MSRVGLLRISAGTTILPMSCSRAAMRGAQPVTRSSRARELSHRRLGHAPLVTGGVGIADLGCRAEGGDRPVEGERELLGRRSKILFESRRISVRSKSTATIPAGLPVTSEKTALWVCTSRRVPGRAHPTRRRPRWADCGWASNSRLSASKRWASSGG